MKKKFTEGITAIMLALLLLLCNVGYIYFSEGLSAFQAIYIVTQEFARWLKYMTLGLFIIAFVLFVFYVLGKLTEKENKK